jgi:hypothetical protein
LIPNQATENFEEEKQMFTQYDIREYALSETCKWSGKAAVPAIGTRVNVTINGLGQGIVEAYFIESVYLGVYVKLENPPAWWVKQTAGKTFGRRTGCAMVFGAEIEPVVCAHDNVDEYFLKCDDCGADLSEQMEG